MLSSYVDDVLTCLFTAPPNQEGTSAGVERLSGGVLHDRRTLPGRISGALGLSDDQRGDHRALEDLEVRQKHRCSQNCIFMLVIVHAEPKRNCMSDKAVAREDHGMEGMQLCSSFNEAAVPFTGDPPDWIQAGGPHVWAGWNQWAQEGPAGA